MTLITKIRKSTLYVIPSQLGIKLIAMVAVVVLARFLDVEQYGIYNLVFGTTIVFSYFCNYGLASSLQRFLAEYSQMKNTARIAQTMLFSHVFRFITSVITLVAAYYWFDVWAAFFNIEGNQDVFLYFSIGAVLLFQVEYFQTELSAMFLHAPLAIVLVVLSLVKFILVVALLYYGFGLAGVFVGEALAYLTGFLLCIYVVYRYVLRDAKKGLFATNQIEFKRIARYSAYNALVGPGAMLYSQTMDLFVVAAMANPYQLGLYSLASRTSNMIQAIMPHKLLQSIIQPAFYQQYYAVGNQRAELEKMFNALIKIIAGSVVPALVCAALLAEHLIVALFGEKYLDASQMMVVLLLFSIFTVIELPSNLVLQAAEKVQAQMFAQIFAVYNLISAIILMNYFGVIGVAYATGSALMLKCLFLCFMVYRYTKITPNIFPLLRIAINTAITGAVVWLVGARGVDLQTLLLAALSGSAVYLALFFVNNPLGDYEKQKLNQYMKKKLF